MENKTAWAIGGVVALVILIAIFGSSNSNNTSTQTTPTDSSQNNNSQNVFYTQTVANVRSCPSTSCASLGTYPANTDLTLPYAAVADLPEWIEFSLPDNSGVTQTGYINKSTLGINKVDIAPKQQTQQPPTPTYTETNSSCKLKAEGVLNSSWIRTCNLRGQLTYQCQQLFDSDGYHKNFPQTGDPNWSQKFGQILNDIAACECQLPPDVVANLRYTQQSSNNSCDQFYPK